MRKYVENFDYFFNKDAIRKDNNNEFILDSNLFDNKNGIENSLVKVQDNFNLQKFIEDANTNGKKFEIGVCVHAVDYLFNQIANSNNKVFKIKISYLEIYNEQVMDLLIEKSPPLMIVEDAQKGVTVPDLTEFSVNNSSELIKLIIEGNQRRTMAATGQNQFSSRSHAILQILIDQRSKIKDIKEEYLVSKFLLVDLAGSERGGLEKGMRTHEGKNINKSLLSLGNCINILSDKSKKGAFVPYRDSKLTRLLKDSLGGNIMTVMIACVSPAAISYDETVNTLKYAMRARKIEKKISKNVREVDVHISQYREIIDSLKSEIDQLRQIIKEQETVIHKGNIDIETDKDLSKNQDENNLKISKHISKSNDKINFRSRENSKDKENRINEKNDSEYIKLKEILSLNNKNEKEFSNLKKSTESLDLFKIGEPKGFQSENQINVISKIENRDNLKNSISPNKVYFQKNKNIKSSTQIDHKNTIRDNSLCSSAEQSQKNTYGSLYKKRTYTQNHVNDSKTKNNTSHRIMSDNQENKNNISSPDSINIRDFDLNGYKSFLNKSGDEDFNMEELEKQVENLNNDKIFIEDLLQKGSKANYSITEKYKTIQSCYEKYLHYINDKLIQNIEESMILKFNLKEILDLNLMNQNNINTLSIQTSNLEKLIQEKNSENIQSIEKEISIFKEEIMNVNNAIKENDNLKEKIAESLKKNIRFKDFLKKILLKLISKSQKKESNLEEAFLKIVKEKEELERKNKTYEKHLSTILKEKHVKESKLDKVEDELNKLKKIIEEKDKRLKNLITFNVSENNKYGNSYSKNKMSQSRGRDFSNKKNIKIISSISLEKNNAKNKINQKEDTKTKKIINPHLMKTAQREKILIQNLTNSTNNIYDENLTEQDKIEINLQDEYAGTKKKFINDINNVSHKTNCNNQENNKFIREHLNTNSINNIVADKDEVKIEIDLQNLINNKKTSINNQASVQNIKYIINQTNNIVNNNINKINEKDNLNIKKTINKFSYNSVTKFSSNNHNPKNSLNVRESYKEKIKEAMNLNNKDLINPKRNRMNSLQKSTKKNSIISNNLMDFYEEKILKTNNIDAYEKDSIKNGDSKKNNLDSPRKKLIDEKLNTQVNLSNKKNSKNFKEYNKIIENQLNEVYNKKSKEIGEKIKRNIKSANYSKNKIFKKNSLQTIENNVQILSELNQISYQNNSATEKELANKQPNLNGSLSISCVSINQEIGFFSELDIVDQINDQEINLNDANTNKNKIYVKKSRQDSNALLNCRYNRKYKKISIINSNNNNYNKNNKKVSTGQISENTDQLINPGLDISKKQDLKILDSEFKINQENEVKKINLKEVNTRKSQVNEGLIFIESNLVNKKPSFNINPSPIKIDNNFANNFINAKKIKPIEFNSSTDSKKNDERYINFPKTNVKNINEFISNIEEDIKNLDVFNNDINKKMKENEFENGKISDYIQNPNTSVKDINRDTFQKNFHEKSKKGLMNLIPFNKNITISDISNKRASCKFNSSKSIHSNSLLNSAEIREDILINVSNLNSNRNKQNLNSNLNVNNKPVLISVSNKLLSKVNVQKFINSPNNNKEICNENEKLNQNQAKNELNLNYENENSTKHQNDNLKDCFINKGNTSDLKKYITDEDINNFLNEFKSIRKKPIKENADFPNNEKNTNLNLSKDKIENNNNNRVIRERSLSILKKARMERKIIKSKYYFEIDSPNKQDENIQNKSIISNLGNEKNNISSHKINNVCSRYSSTNKKTNKINTSISEKNSNNFKYLKNNFNSYKYKKLEKNMIRKGSNISKHSVDFVNEYINHKKNKIPINFENKNEDKEKITVNRELYKRLSSNEKINEMEVISLKNCHLDYENFALYNDDIQEVKAIFIQNNKEPEKNLGSNHNYDMIQVKKFISSNILSNDFTSKFLSIEK